MFMKILVELCSSNVGSRTKEHKVALVKEEYRLDIRKLDSLDKPMASLSTCHLKLITLDGMVKISIHVCREQSYNLCR